MYCEGVGYNLVKSVLKNFTSRINSSPSSASVFSLHIFNSTTFRCSLSFPFVLLRRGDGSYGHHHLLFLCPFSTYSLLFP